jgi:hypothetical protein
MAGCRDRVCWRLRLRTDGSATSTGFSYDPYAQPFPSGEATWELRPPGSTSGDDLDVTTATVTLPFSLMGSRSSPVLYLPGGNDQTCGVYRFTRA